MILKLFDNVLLRKESVPGKSLNLGKDDTLQKQVETAREKYVSFGHQIKQTEQ